MLDRHVGSLSSVRRLGPKSNKLNYWSSHWAFILLCIQQGKLNCYFWLKLSADLKRSNVHHCCWSFSVDVNSFFWPEHDASTLAPIHKNALQLLHQNALYGILSWATSPQGMQCDPETWSLCSNCLQAAGKANGHLSWRIVLGDCDECQRPCVEGKGLHGYLRSLAEG
jgi:hypothetical protein